MNRLRTALIPAIIIVCIGALGLYGLQRYWRGFRDQNYQLDYTWQGRDIGTALRLSNSGLLGGGRYWVIVAQSSGNPAVLLHRGPSLYPDSDPRPTLLAAQGDTVYYHLYEGHIIAIDLRTEHVQSISPDDVPPDSTSPPISDVERDLHH